MSIFKKANAIPGANKAPTDALLPFEPRLEFQCNICDTINFCKTELIGREERSCTNCGSTLRFRSMVHYLTSHLFGRSMTLSELHENKSIRGIGMTDWDGYAEALTKKLGYLNTYYHQEPKLDITNPPSDIAGLDFILSSDVMEHVPPPIQRGFDNLAKLLKAGGVLILTVPFSCDATTKEHFPDLYEYEIKSGPNGRRLLNTTRLGEKQVFENLVFHGGDGSTLEMRLFCRDALVAHLQQAGFADIRVHAEPYFKFGIFTSEPWSLPISAVRAH
jgi:SAM-dependent methyltransferase